MFRIFLLSSRLPFAARFSFLLFFFWLWSPGRSEALEFHIGKEQLRLHIIETLSTSYHGDLPPLLISETDGNGRPTDDFRFFDILNRLNVDLSWRNFRLWTRFDTAAYFGFPKGGCGPTATTSIYLRSRYCENPFYLEKIALEYIGRRVEATLGDLYVSFGRGLVLSLRKLDELGVDTTLRGAKFVYHDGRATVILLGGITNIQNADQATGRFISDPLPNFLNSAPHDIIAGARGEYRLLNRVNVGAHVAGGIQGQNLSLQPQDHPDSMLMYGASIDVPRLTRFLSLYLEGAGQRRELADKLSTGYGLYGAATGYFGPFSLLVEGKFFKNFQRWQSSIPTTYVEFAPVAYNQPPTAERLETELTAPVYDVRGVRLRADARVNDKVVFYLSTAYFDDNGFVDTPKSYYDPYGGLEIRWGGGASHFFPSGGYRLELDRRTGKEFQHVGHVEWDFSQALPHGFSVEAEGFALFRQGDDVNAERPDGTIYAPTWTEGTTYIAFKWTPKLLASIGYEWTTRPDRSTSTHHYVNGTVQWNITPSSSLRAFVGGNRGGLKCISGICRDFPDFTGARLELVLRL
jgi:hypothetical protein